MGITEQTKVDAPGNTLFILYSVFTISWFLHFTARMPALGTIRFDLILLALIAIGIFFNKSGVNEKPQPSPINTVLTVLIVYSLLEIPFVKWPGSVIQHGIANFIKGIVFFYFTVEIIKTEKLLKYFLLVFVGCQTFRVLEPLYLHMVDGYWGSTAYMGGAFMERLAGAPSDIVNPNGLAFIICGIIPFFYFLARSAPRPVKLLIFAIYPALGYALLLTASRTGLLALAVILIAIFIRSKKKVVLSIIFVLAAAFTIAHMTELQQERYLSLGEKDVRGAATAEGRLEGVISNFEVGMNRPIFGHGLGTSQELNYNYLGNAQPAHNLYAEVFQELGVIGLIIYVVFIWLLFKNIRLLSRQTATAEGGQDNFFRNTVLAVEAWFYMNLLFSLASYGLSGYQWYLTAGLIVALGTFRKWGTTTDAAICVKANILRVS